MHEAQLLEDLAVVMILAGIVTVLFHRFKQPVVLGYILAGIIIGPHTPPHVLIHDPETINTLAELGVILLMFSLGLEFSLRKLKKVGASALIAALLEILLMLWIGYEVGLLFGWSKMDSIFLGAILSISSTTIIIKALHDLGKAKERFAQFIFGVLILEDILGIAIIALLSGMAMTGTLSVRDVGVTLGKLGIFLSVALIFGLLTVPRLIGYVAKFRSNEMLLISSLGLCFGFALLAAKLGYSVALGAFIIGAILAEAREIHRIEALTQPVRDMFSAIFFVTIGLMIDPKVLVQYWLPILVITCAVVIGKVVTCSLGAFAGGNDLRTSLRAGMGLAQIGEFSFIIASLGVTLKVTSEFLYPIAVTVSAITTLLTPYLIKSTDGVVNWFDRVAPPRVLRLLELYTQRVGQWRTSGHPSVTGKLIRRWSWQMALNLTIACGIFIGGSFLGAKRPAIVQDIPGEADAEKAVLCLVAIILAAPLLIATYRKLQALGLLLGEMASHRLDKNHQGISAVISHTVPTIGAIGMALLILVLCSAILPSIEILGVVVLIIIAVTALLWRNMVRLYSKAQFALGQTFAENPAEEDEHPLPAPTLPEETRIERLEVNPGSFAHGKLIGEVALRSETGASVVVIRRDGKNLVNPGPDEEFMSGDSLMIFGLPSQIEAAQALLLKKVE